MATFKIDLDTSKQSIVPQVVRGRVGDSESCIIEAHIFEMGAAYDMTDKSARFECTLSDGHQVRDPDVEVDGNVLKYIVPYQVLSASGITKPCYFRILNDAGSYIDSTESFQLKVETAIDPEYGGDYFPELDSAVSAAKQQESIMAHAEADRISAEEQRSADELVRIENEAARVAAEAARQAAELVREANEDVRDSNEDERIDAEAARQAAEDARVLEEARRVAEFAEMEQRANGWLYYYCQEGEYDPMTRKPLIEEPDLGTIYNVPAENPTETNRWNEWRWSSVDDDWESMGGGASAAVSPVTTAQIDAIFDDESVVSSNVVNATGFAYIWAKIKAWAQSAFAPFIHVHSASDITEGTFDTEMLADGAITAPKLAENAVGAAALADGCVGMDKLGDDVKESWDSRFQNFGLTFEQSVAELKVGSYGRGFQLWVTNADDGTGNVVTIDNGGINFYSVDTDGGTTKLWKK